MSTLALWIGYAVLVVGGILSTAFLFLFAADFVATQLLWRWNGMTEFYAFVKARAEKRREQEPRS